MRSGSLMLMPIEAQKIEGIGQSPLEEDVRDRDKEPTRTINRAAIITSFGCILEVAEGLEWG